MVSPEPGKRLEPTPEGGPNNNNRTLESMQCDTTDNSVSIMTDISSDLSVHSDYLPYSLISTSNNTLPGEDDSENQIIQVIIRNRTEGWSTKRNLPAGWIRDITIVRRENRVLLAQKLPTIFVTNHR